MKRKTEITIIAVVIIAAILLALGIAYKNYVKMEMTKTVVKSASNIGNSLIGGAFAKK